MIRTLLLPCFAGIALLTQAQIVNPGFENGLSGWQATCEAEVYLTSDVPPFGGSSSMAVTMLSTTEPFCFHGGDLILPFVYQTLPGLQNGDQIGVHLWSKPIPDLPENAMWMQGEIMLGWMTSPTTFGSCALGPAGGGGPVDWTTSTFIATLSGMPPGATAVLLLGGHAFANTNGTMLFDNVHIRLPGTGTQLSASVWLDGPFDEDQDLMRDDLRQAGLIPSGEPYTAMFGGSGGGETVSPSVLSVSGNDAIVDWVRIELRHGLPYYNSPVHITKRHALLQRDGDIVDLDGISPVSFDVGPGNYHVVVQHRNHLPVMTAYAVTLTSTAATVDFRDPATVCYTRAAPGATPGTDLPRRAVGGTRTLWAGDVAPFWEGVKYSGPANDRDPILYAIGGIIPTNTISGYRAEDVNMDGVVKYAGLNNDRDIVLMTIGGLTPTAIRLQQVPFW